MIPNPSDPLVYLITDRRKLPHESSKIPFGGLIDFIASALVAGVDLIQIRERDLSTRDLYHLAASASRLASQYKGRILVNDRADVAASAGTGVHLTSRSISPEVVLATFGADILIGVSTHSLQEAEVAGKAGADFIVFGPVFETESKKAYGPPVGVEALGAVCHRLKIPVLALGGIKTDNFRVVLEAGAAGIAAISLFAEAGDIEQVVRAIKGR